MRERIEVYLNELLGLELKYNWQVFKFEHTDKEVDMMTGEIIEKNRGRQLDFMGMEFWRDKTIMRKGIMLKATRKANRISKKVSLNHYDSSSMLSYMGYVKHTDTYEMYRRRIKPNVDIKKCRHTVSKHNKRRECKVEHSIELERNNRLSAGTSCRNRGWKNYCILAEKHIKKILGGYSDKPCNLLLGVP